MKKLTQTLIKYTIWAFIFAATSYVYATSTFTEPTGGFGGFPNNNTDAPINVSATAQNKLGSLGVDQLCDELGANCIKQENIVSTSTTPQTKLGPLTTTGFTSLSFGYIGTNLSVGTANNPAPLGLVGLFNGNVGAIKYCTSTGTDCASTFSGQVVYLPTPTPWSRGYSYLSCSNTCVKANSTISIASLKSSYPVMQNETRNIKGVIVDYYLIFEGNSTLQNLRYKMELWDDGGMISSTPVEYVQSSVFSSAEVRDSNKVAFDRDGDGIINLTCYTSKYNQGALNSSASQNCGGSILGYIVQ